jgi:hypothetical protein
MKKAQSQIITTVLIILLVLAAIVIVWQVVNTTVTGGGDEVEAQAACIGLSITLTAENGGVVYVKPNKDILGYRVYVNGSQIDTSTHDTVPIAAFVTKNSTATVATGDVITSAGLLGTQWCEGLNPITVA